MRGLPLILTGLLFFLAGLGIGNIDFAQEVPAAIEEPAAQEALPLTALDFETETPHNRVAEDKIHVYPDRIVLDIPNAGWARFAGTGSMEPVFNEGANAIQGVPSTTADIHIGDIISYERGDDIVIHRVMELGQDEEGWYAITKGDNNPVPDAQKVRFEQVISVVLAIIY